MENRNSNSCERISRRNNAEQSGRPVVSRSEFWIAAKLDIDYAAADPALLVQLAGASIFRELNAIFACLPKKRENDFKVSVHDSRNKNTRGGYFGMALYVVPQHAQQQVRVSPV